MKLEKIGRTVHADGATEILYQYGEFQIESRKRMIAHANRSGSWAHTTYFLIRPDGTEKEYYSLTDAKAAAEVSDV